MRLIGRSPYREEIVEQLDFLGFSLDADKNIDGRIDVPILRINSDDDKQIYVILTDEQLELALSLEHAITIKTHKLKWHTCQLFLGWSVRYNRFLSVTYAYRLVDYTITNININSDCFLLLSSSQGLI